jgi:hypothetical protein
VYSPAQVKKQIPSILHFFLVTPPGMSKSSKELSWPMSCRLGSENTATTP